MKTLLLLAICMLTAPGISYADGHGPIGGSEGPGSAFYLATTGEGSDLAQIKKVGRAGEHRASAGISDSPEHGRELAASPPNSYTTRSQ